MILTPAEVVKRRAEIATAIAKAKATRPLSAANLQNWLDGKSTTVVMSAATFKHVDSEVPSFLAGTARNVFERGFKRRLTNRADPQGTLLPTALTVGALGPIRFLEYRDGVRPSAVATNFSADLFTALGSYNVHSAIWAQATFKGTTGGFLGIGTSNVFDVQVLRWCVQIYDVYDWNLGGVTPFPVSDADLKTLPLPPGAVTVQALGMGMNMVLLQDRYLRDLEVSGGGRAFLIRGETFEAPNSVMGAFTITI